MQICRRLKNVLHFVQQKMLFKQKISYQTSGPPHSRRFVSTLEVPIQSAAFQSLDVLPSSATVNGDVVTFMGGGLHSPNESPHHSPLWIF